MQLIVSSVSICPLFKPSKVINTTKHQAAGIWDHLSRISALTAGHENSLEFNKRSPCMVHWTKIVSLSTSLGVRVLCSLVVVTHL